MPSTDNAVQQSATNFPIAGGEMAGRIRAHDWAATSLGPIKDWPQSLRTVVDLMLGQPNPASVLWGPDRVQLYNDAYMAVAADRHPGALGRPAAENWSEAYESVLQPAFGRVFAGETVTMDAQAVELRNSDGVVEERHFTGSWQPVRDESGRVAGVFHPLVEVTAKVRAEGEAEAHAARQEFRLELEGRLGGLTEPLAMMEAAAALLGHHLGVAQVGFAEVKDDQKHIVVARDWNDGRIPSVAGRWRMDDFGPAFIRELKAGETVVIADVSRDPRTSAPDVVAAYDSIATSAILDVPLVRDGRMLALLFIHHCEPRVWTPEEVALVEETCGRLRSAVERARAEAALRESEARWRGLFAASPTPIAVLAPDAPRFTITEVNDAYLANSSQTREALVRRGVFEAFPDNPNDPGATGVANLRASLERTLATRKPDTMPVQKYDVERPDGGFEERWWDSRNSPVLDERGEVEAIVHHVIEVTDKFGAEAELRDSEARQRFLLALERSLRDLADPREMVGAAVEALGRHLGVTRVGYGEFRDDGATIDFQTDYADGVAHLIGTFPADKFGSDNIADLRRGLTTTCADLEDDPRTAEAGFPAIDARSAMAVPLIREGRLRALLYLNHRDVREWLPAEVALVEDVAARTWDSLARARAEAGLRQSEEFSRRVLAASADCIMVLSLDGRLELMSEGGMCAMEVDDFGAIEGACWPDFWQDEDRVEVLAAVEEARRGGTGRFQGFATTMKGSPRWWDVIVTPIDGPDGRPEKLLSVSRDVTAVRLAEEALRDTTRRLDAILANTREAVFLIDERQHCVFANRAAQELTGYSFAELQGRPLHDVVHHKRPDGSHYPLEECPINRAFSERAQMSGEELFVAPDGSFYPVAFTASPVLDDAGRPVGTVIEARDITAEKAATDRLAQLAAISEQSLDFIGVADPAGRPVYVNEAGRAMMGLPSLEAACAVDLIDYFADRHKALIREEALPAASRDGYWEGEAAFRRFDDGREFPVLYNIFPVRDAAGAITHYATVTRDLTEKKNVEAELRRLNAALEARIEERTQELSAAEEQLRQAQKLDAMGQLTGGVAHDFNNLLTPIIGALDLLLRRGVHSERERRLMDGALQSAERAKTLVQRLLAFARRQPLQPTAVDLRGVVEGMTDLIDATSGPQIEVRLELEPDLPPVTADSNQLEMALLNLAVNARDAMPDGGALTIAARRESVRDRHGAALGPGHYVVLSVRDTGVGMDAATLKRAVEPFFSTKGIGKGTGLGLSMVHGLVAQLGGGLVINSAPGRGTTMELWLPVSLVPVEMDDTAHAAPEARVRRGMALLVDDEDLVRMSTADMLIDLGFEVIEASSAEEAWCLVQKGTKPDLLLTDHLMPGMNGADLARKLRETRPDLPVLIVSGYAEADGVAADLPRLTKPFRNAELAAKLNELTQS